MRSMPRIGWTLRPFLPAAYVFHEQGGQQRYGYEAMSEIATRIVYQAIARYEGRPFTPVLAVLMEDVANKALRDMNIPIIAKIAPRLAAGGVLDVSFKPKPALSPITFPVPSADWGTAVAVTECMHGVSLHEYCETCPQAAFSGEGTVELVKPDGTRVSLGTAAKFEAGP
jgi:hypothetical protein